jgi:hypothetical protein
MQRRDRDARWQVGAAKKTQAAASCIGTCMLVASFPVAAQLMYVMLCATVGSRVAISCVAIVFLVTSKAFCLVVLIVAEAGQ